MPTIRAARVDDIPQVLSLWTAERSSVAVMPDTREALTRLLRADRHALFVAEAAGRIVGTLIDATDGWRGNMYRLVVDPDWRRRGIARNLVLAGEERFRQLGIPRVTALVGLDEIGAGELWKAMSYKHDPAVGRFVRNL